MENKRFKLTQEQFDLLWLSALSLFFELVAIRWLASEIRAFTIFKNFPLIACYVGLGYGYMKDTGNGLFKLFPFLLLALVAIVSTSDLTGLTYMLVPGLRTGIHAGWMDMTHPPKAAIEDMRLYTTFSIAVFFGIFVLVAAMMAAMGQKLGKLFNSGPALQSYLVNLIGSALGILVFSILSFCGMPPLVWITIGCVCALWSFRETKVGMAVLVGVIALVALMPARSVFDLGPNGKPRIEWSPYHRVDVAPQYYGDPKAPDAKRVGLRVSVNKGYFQQALNLSPEFINSLPDAERKRVEDFRFDQYELPYFFLKPKRVLIMGAGTGNDVASALKNGAEYIDAVEIDPKMVELGKELHPEHPYDSPKVHVHVNDARAFLRQNPDKKYDLVLTGFLDSHTVAGNSLSVRLDDYVYTVDGMKDAIDHVAPGGVYSITYCDAEKMVGWLSQRLVKNIRIAAGDGTQTMIVKKDDGGIWHLFAPATPEMLSKIPELVKDHAYTDETNMDPGDIRSSTDDWPFLYLSTMSVDPLYLAINACILLLAWATCGTSIRKNSLARRWHLFFLGAAFMLLELSIIDRLALVFGTTWFVNSVCIFAVLTAIILSNLLVIKKPNLMSLPVMYACLLGSLVAVYLTPLQSLTALGMWVGGGIASALSAIPIFFAGLIFSTSFKSEDKPSAGLAFNILGAVIGGLLEYVATYTGIRSLLLVAAVLYGISLFIWNLGNKKGKVTPSPAD